MLTVCVGDSGGPDLSGWNFACFLATGAYRGKGWFVCAAKKFAVRKTFACTVSTEIYSFNINNKTVGLTELSNFFTYIEADWEEVISIRNGHEESEYFHSPGSAVYRPGQQWSF